MKFVNSLNLKFIRLIKYLTKILILRNRYKINFVKIIQNDLLISFYAPGSRIPYLKPAMQIIKDVNLMTKFNPMDAFYIGFCSSMPSIENLVSITTYLYKERIHVISQ